jgi:LysM repeat protein
MTTSAQAIIHQQQEADGPGLTNRFISHEVMPGETWYRLGKIYHLDPAVIARTNGMTVDSVLRVHVPIKIPLLAENFIQPHQIPSEGYQPVFHQVMPGETLYHISTRYKPATIEDLRAWNHLTSNDIRSGQLLVVGYMRFNADALPISSSASTTPYTQSPGNHSTSSTQRDTSFMFGAIAPRAAANGHIPSPISEEHITAQPYHPLTSLQQTQEAVIHTHQSGQEDASTGPVISSAETKDINLFQQDYLQQFNQPGWKQAEVRGAAGWFSSNIPPSSKKYYVLFDNAPRGQIIQITNPLNGKSIYAKVLDVIPKLGENANLIVKISDAAQKDLGITQDKFFCIVHYFASDKK